MPPQVIDIQGELDEIKGLGGGALRLPPGLLTTPDGGQFHVDDRCGVICEGGMYGSLTPTTVTFDPDLIAQQPYQACVLLNGLGSVLEGFAIAGPSINDRVPRCVRVRGHAAVCRFMQAFWATEFGFHVEARVSDNSNANNFGLEHCRAARCGKAGFYTNGEEANAGYIIGCIADGNEGYGFFESSFLGNPYYGCHASNNPLGNYCQGGNVDDPLDGGTANYTVLDGCYAEGPVPNKFRSGNVFVSGGNLPLTVAGWPDANGNPTPFPGSVTGFRSRFNTLWRGAELSPTLRENLSMSMPFRVGVRSGAFTHQYLREQKVGTQWQPVYPDSDSEPHYAFERYASSNPSWLANTRCLDRLGTSWWTPMAWSDERHPLGAGRPMRTMPKINTPFDFTLRQSLVINPYQAVVARFDHDFLRESAGGYLGTLTLHAPSITYAVGGAAIHDDWTRIDDNTVQTVVENPGLTTAAVTVVLVGERVQY